MRQRKGKTQRRMSNDEHGNAMLPEINIRPTSTGIFHTTEQASSLCAGIGRFRSSAIRDTRLKTMERPSRQAKHGMQWDTKLASEGGEKRDNDLRNRQSFHDFGRAAALTLQSSQLFFALLSLCQLSCLRCGLGREPCSHGNPCLMNRLGRNLEAEISVKGVLLLCYPSFLSESDLSLPLPFLKLQGSLARFGDREAYVCVCIDGGASNVDILLGRMCSFIEMPGTKCSKGRMVTLGSSRLTVFQNR
jgi:hypothetical protein